METTATFIVNEIGQNTGMPYEGKFVIKTILSRRDNFIADERRRMIIGMNPAGAMPSLQGEALMLSLLSVRIMESPKWWTDSDNGLDLKDENIIGVLYQLCEEKAKEYQADLAKNAKASLEKLSKKIKTAPQEE